MLTKNQTILVNARVFDASVFRVLEMHADYVCGNTGLCCRQPWGIHISDAEYKTMEQAMAHGGVNGQEIEKHFVACPSKEDPGRRTFAHNGHQGCVFVGQDTCNASTCQAQHQWGHEVLPAVCQSYPRLAVGTPDGVYLTLSYTCPTAARLLLTEDGIRETAPRKVFGLHPQLQGISFGPGSKKPAFAKGCHPDWAVFDYFWRWAADGLARPEFTPAQALYLLGQTVGQIEQHGAAAGQLPVLMDLLDQVMALEPNALRSHCEAVEPITELGAVYLNVLLNLLGQTGEIPPVLGGMRETLARPPEDPARRQILDAYDRLIRPHLAEYERIERNFIGSRLYANPLIYRSKRLRIGYFLAVLSLIELRFVALAICLNEGVSLDENVWLRAAAQVDMILQHSGTVQEKFIDLLARHAADCDLSNLTRPALF